MKMSSKMRILRGPGALRVKLGMSQEMFAQYLGIAPSTVSMAELGHRPFPKKAVQRLTEREIALAGKGREAAGKPTQPVVISTAHQELIQQSKLEGKIAMLEIVIAAHEPEVSAEAAAVQPQQHNSTDTAVISATAIYVDQPVGPLPFGHWLRVRGKEAAA